MEKDRALDIAMTQIERRFGKGSIMVLGKEGPLQEVEAIPTGALALDIALGIGGVPRGRVVEIYGPNGSGKTTLALHIIAEAQKMGGTAAFIDAEHALDPIYARDLGVNTDELLLSQPDTGEQALEIAEMLIRSGALDVLVIDTVASLVPRAEIEGRMGDSHMGLQARLMSQALRKLAGTINKSNTCSVFINQVREKIGIIFGDPETTPGGRALKFYSTVRMRVSRSANIKVGTDIIGSKVRVRIVKNKVAPPFRKVEFDIIYGKGISKEGSLIDLGVEKGIITKSGTWYSFSEEQIGQGKENTRQFLIDNPKIASKIEEKIRAEAGLLKEKESEEVEKKEEQK